MSSLSSVEHSDARYDCNYSLEDIEITMLVDRLISEHPPTCKDAIVCYELEHGLVENVARTIERIVFENRFGNNEEAMHEIYGPYESASKFFLSVNQYTHMPVGVLRVMQQNTEKGLMTLDTLPEQALNSKTIDAIRFQYNSLADEGIWDVGTVAILPDFQKDGRGISVQLYRAMYKSAMENHIRHLLAIIDKKPYETMTEYLGIPFNPLEGTVPFSYEGSTESVAVHGYVPDFYPVMKRKSHTLKGFLARKALNPLVFGSKDDAIFLR